MAAFNDASCPKCGKRFGWQGEVTDRPPCPRCGYQIPKEELEKFVKIIRNFEDMLRERKNDRLRKE